MEGKGRGLLECGVGLNHAFDMKRAGCCVFRIALSWSIYFFEGSVACENTY